MSFGKKSSMPCMVFEYGCLHPVDGEEIMLEQIKRRNNMWNSLVAIEKTYREAVRSEITIQNDQVTILVAELDATRKMIKQQRKAARSGKVDISDLCKLAEKLKEDLTQARAAAKVEKKRIIEEKRTKLNEIESGRKELQKDVQHESGLYWGNYDDVIASYDVARKRAMREGRELRFHRFDGTGKISVRWQNGLPVPELFNCADTRLQINPVPEAAWYSDKRWERRKLARTKVRIRITSDENRKPIWLELPVIIHRPLPEDGIIRSASVIREKVGDKYSYKLVITVAFEPIQHIPAKNTAVGIDLGWRSVKNGLRVAFWKDELGNGDDLVIPNRAISQFEKLDDLKSIRDKHFNDIRNTLLTFLTDNKDNLPDWLEEGTAMLAQWRSKGRLVFLIRKWQENRFSEDQEIVICLKEWMKQDKHLWDWESNLRDQIIKHRREIYRIFAAKIAKKYNHVFIEDFDLRAVAKKQSPEKGTAGSVPADKQRTIASVSTLRQAIINACRREGAEVVKVPSAYTTVECHVCGHMEKFDAAGHIFRTCPKCKKIWDQDENAAINILRRGLSQIGRGLEQKNDLRKISDSAH